jgi:hypothetical protein
MKFKATQGRYIICQSDKAPFLRFSTIKEANKWMVKFIDKKNFGLYDLMNESWLCAPGEFAAYRENTKRAMELAEEMV